MAVSGLQRYRKTCDNGSARGATAKKKGRRTQKSFIPFLSFLSADVYPPKLNLRRQLSEELLLALALLVCNTTAGLASRLTRGLALAAATVVSALAKVLGFDSLDVFHINTSIVVFIYT